MNRQRRNITKRRNVLVFHRGHKITVPNHPTEICTQPWFPLTVRVTSNGATDTAITLGELYSAWSSQLYGLGNSTSTVNFRIQSIRVWGPIRGTTESVPVTTPLSLSVLDLFDDVNSTSGAPIGAPMILEQITNYPDAVNRARCGYVYSTAQQQKSLFATPGNPEEICRISGFTSSSVAYISVLWRPFSTNVPPVLRPIDDDSDVELISTPKDFSSRHSDVGYQKARGQRR